MRIGISIKGVNAESSLRAELSALSSKEQEALELVAQQFTNKEIARNLKISSRAVEERLKSAREKLDAPDRRTAARRYQALRRTCGQTTGEPTTVETSISVWQQSGGDTTASSQFASRDIGSTDFEHGTTDPTWLEAFDLRFGRIGRVYAVVGLSVLLALLLVAGVTIAVVAKMLT